MASCIFSIVLFSSGWLISVCHASVGGVVAYGFGLSADPLSVTLALGSSGQSIINVSSKGNPISLSVNLSASSIGGVTTSFDPQPVILPPSSGEWHYNQSTLTISASGSATPGIYTLTIYADFGITIQNVNITLTILGNQSHERDITVGGYIVPDNSPTTVAPSMSMLGFVALLAACIVAAVRKEHGVADVRAV